MTTITTKPGKQGTLTIDSKAHNAVLTVEGKTFLIGFVREAKKVIIKNDMLLNDADLAAVRSELAQFIKKVDNSKKRK